MKVCVTGGCGLVGTAISAALLDRGYEVVVADIRADTPIDIRDASALRDVFRGCSGIIHLAAVSRVHWAESWPDRCRAINVDGTRNVIAAVEDVAPAAWLLFASSREVYGDSRKFPISEEFPIAPFNEYGRSKAAGEALVAEASLRGMRTAVLRLSNVYGAMNDHPDRAVPAIVYRALQGEDIVVTGGERFFDFVHVDDTVRGLMSAVDMLQAGARTVGPYNLATGRATRLDELADLAIRKAGSKTKIIDSNGRPFDPTGYVGNPLRSRIDLNWNAEITLADGVEAMIAAYRDRGAPMDPVEVPMAADVDAEALV